MSMEDGFDDVGGEDDLPVDKEAEARAMGWRPFEEYSGPPENWRDAASFVENGMTILPVLRANLRRATEKLSRQESQMAALQAKVQEQTEAVEAAVALGRRANEAGYARGLAELKAKMRDAAAEGDVEAVSNVQEQISAMETERATVDAPPKPAPKSDQPAVNVHAQAIYQEFYDTNPWFNADPPLAQEMMAAHNTVIRRHPGMDLRAQLAEAKRLVMRDFPDKFGKAQARPTPERDDDDDAPPPPSVGRPTGGSAPPRPRGAKGFDQIADPKDRAEARAAFESIKRGQPGYTQEEYLAVYLDPHVDVLSLRKK